jgi:signal recognition particle receptor subunit beta
MEILQLVVTGAVGAGKTSFIRTISEIEVVDTDRRATDEVSQLKSNTTVAFDFGRVTFGPDQAVHIYGTPGQSRFDFIWDMLISKAHAYILLLDAHRPQDIREGRRILTFMNQRVQIPMIIGLTHTDFPDAWEPENIALGLGFMNESERPPIINVNANDQASVFNAIITLVEELMK